MTPAEVWARARGAGIGVPAAERLRAGQAINIEPRHHAPIWGTPETDAPLPTSYCFRLHHARDGWYVEGTDGGPWVNCEGPLPDSGRPPWLARPKDLGGQS